MRSWALAIFLLTLSCALLLNTYAQVTFSRDWSAGKRSFGPLECAAHAHQSASLCQMLLNEIKHLTACEVRLLTHRQRDDVLSPAEKIFRSPSLPADEDS